MIWISRFRETVLNAIIENHNEYIDQIRFWHFSMQNLFFITNRMKHIESKKSVDAVIYNQNKIFVVFVRVSRSENTISHETFPEQWIRIDSILSEIENICRSNSQENLRICQWACNKSDELAMNHEHAMNSKSNKKSFHNSIYFSLSKDD